ncbi:hypothetical protein ACIKT0_00035 [Hansschlegelia beijingensis]|uniref:hypothetical protein n=1 Tax=Hansschlegelia beijingensis TaxID=1133344 RepID=UPI00387F0CCC
MDPNRLRSGFASFVAGLSIADEPISFDRVVDDHESFLTELRAAGLRWRSISRLLAESGARRPDGGVFSADQLRASYSRSCRREAVNIAVVETRTESAHKQPAGKPPGSSVRPNSPDEGRRPNAPLAKGVNSGSVDPPDEDFSAEQLDAVRKRLSMR